MTKSLTSKMYILLFLTFVLFGCSRGPTDYSDDLLSNMEKTDSENQIEDDGRGASQRLSSEDWLIWESILYVKTKEETFQKSDFPHAVQNILHEENDKELYFTKEGNKLIIECQYDFVIYDFEKESIERIELTYGHSDWKILHNQIFYIALDEYERKHMMVYDMQTSSKKEINTGEYVPLQFQVREDGAVGIWGTNNEKRMFCFWSNEKTTYVLDEDMNTGWTKLCDYNERGIIMEREYQTSSLQGTKIYQIQENGMVKILASDGDDSCNANEIPTGKLLFEDNYVMAVDSLNGRVKVYDYEFFYKEKLTWNNLDIKEDMIFEGCCIWNDKIVGLWKNKNEDSLMISEIGKITE